MKKLFLIIFFITIVSLNAFAVDNDSINHDINIQKRIDSIGFNILNSNKINKPVVFKYRFEDSTKFKKSGAKARKITIYDNDYMHAENDDEIAGFLAMKISAAVKSYDNSAIPVVNSLQSRIMPKKYEIFYDKQAVDFMVNAGYNPLGLITFITKTCPQKNSDFISRHNLTSKRLAIIYERIFTQYPYFLTNNVYIRNDYYQNFLLNSIENRKLLEDKLKYNYHYEIHYE